MCNDCAFMWCWATRSMQVWVTIGRFCCCFNCFYCFSSKIDKIITIQRLALHITCCMYFEREHHICFTLEFAIHIFSNIVLQPDRHLFGDVWEINIVWYCWHHMYFVCVGITIGKRLEQFPRPHKCEYKHLAIHKTNKWLFKLIAHKLKENKLKYITSSIEM